MYDVDASKRQHTVAARGRRPRRRLAAWLCLCGWPMVLLAPPAAWAGDPLVEIVADVDQGRFRDVDAAITRALAAGPTAYAELSSESDAGYPLRKRLQVSIAEGSLVWAPAIAEGAVLLSARGGDYELTVGQDLSVGYAGTERHQVELYITESFTFRVLESKAAVLLKRNGGG